MTEQKQKNLFDKNFFIGGAFGVITVLVSFIVLFGVGVKVYNWDGDFAKRVSKLINYPVVMVDYSVVPYSDYLTDLEALTKFITIQNASNGQVNQITKNEISKIVVEQFINRELIEDRLRSYGIKISDEEVESEYQKIVEQVGSEDGLKEELKKLYGFSKDEFIDKILRYGIMENKLKNKLSFDMTIEENKQAYQKASDILQKIKNGESFEELAKTQSQDDGSIENGGDIGFVKKGDLVESFEKVAFGLEVGKISDVVTTEFGYHIIKLEEKKQADENNPETYKVKHILIRSVSLPEYIKKAKDSSTIFYFIKDIERE